MLNIVGELFAGLDDFAGGVFSSEAFELPQLLTDSISIGVWLHLSNKTTIVTEIIL